MSSAEKVDEFIAGKIDEEAFLRKVVAGEERVDTERMLNRVQAIQGELNARLRQGVGSIQQRRH